MTPTQFADLLREAANRIEDGTCRVTQAQIDAIVDDLNNRPMSKEQARVYLGISRSQFDKLVTLGRLPRGRKVRGFTNLVWFRRDLLSDKKKGAL